MLHRLPPELINLIVKSLIVDDINSALHLLQSCQSLLASEEYDRVRYLALRRNLGYPTQRRLPANLRYEADILAGSQSIWRRGRETETEVVTVNWNRVPHEIEQSNGIVSLSKTAKLFQDQLYSLSEDAKCLYYWLATPPEKGPGQDKPASICFDESVLAYDVDLDAGILAVIVDGRDNYLYLLVYQHDNHADTLLQRHHLGRKGHYPTLVALEVNGSAILLNIDNDVHVYDWRRRSEDGKGGRCIWSRKATAERHSEGWYVRGTLFSSQVVACIVISTYRTIGSMRIGHGVVELYRLDQMVPRVADIILPGSHVDALHPRLLQDPYRYLTFDLGGKTALRDCLQRRYDGPALLQTFSETVSIGFVLLCMPCI